MDKRAVARALEQIASFLELQGDGVAAVRVYRTAARAVETYGGDLAADAASGALARHRGVSPETLAVVRDVLATGRSSLLDELREKIPPGLIEMLQIPGLGVRKIRQIHTRLGVESLAELDDAAADGRLAALPRFGARTAANVRRGIAALRHASVYRLLHHALDEAAAVERALSGLAGVLRVTLAGSVRRRLELIRDLDVVVAHAPGAREALIRRLGEAPGVIEFAGRAGVVTLRFATGSVVDVFLTTADAYGTALARATGSAAHWTGLAQRASARGLDLDAPHPDEERFYAALGLPWIPPELREGTGEIEAAETGCLPRLVARDDVRGFIHCHTEYSDGTTTVAAWADACGAAGYEWVGVTDHSGAAPYAGGLGPGDVPRQHAEIDALNARSGGIRVLKGIEADILADGTLDYGPDVLPLFDFVIGSVHARFAMSEAEMTARLLRAMDDPHLTIIGHPTGRLLLSREPYAVDLNAVFRRAAERGVAIELNADPHRLDLDWRLVREARAAGVTISIGADAHSVAGLANAEVGLGMARKGWLEPEQVLNTRTADELVAFARRRRGR